MSNLNNINISLTKVCHKCLKNRDINDFYVTKTSIDGTKTYRNECKECIIQVSKSRYNKSEKNEKVTCECGRVILKIYLEEHRQSKIHFKNLEIQKIIIINKECHS